MLEIFFDNGLFCARDYAVEAFAVEQPSVFAGQHRFRAMPSKGLRPGPRRLKQGHVVDVVPASEQLGLAGFHLRLRQWPGDGGGRGQRTALMIFRCAGPPSGLASTLAGRWPERVTDAGSRCQGKRAPITLFRPVLTAGRSLNRNLRRR
jgi:hypothetical protein